LLYRLRNLCNSAPLKT